MITSDLETAFNQLSNDYDFTFSHSLIGGYLRKRVHRALVPFLKQSSYILELNCGTGEDALYLAQKGHTVLATDISQKMLNVAQKKVQAAELTQNISFLKLDLNKMAQHNSALNESVLPEIIRRVPFDCILSNFGGLNCVPELEPIIDISAQLLSAEGLICFVIMGPNVPWEWLWFGLQGRVNTALRRIRKRAYWQGNLIYYPPLSSITRGLAKDFTILHREALGAVVPPPYTESLFIRLPKLLSLLFSLEARFSTFAPLVHLSDHYVIIARKKE